MQSMTKPKQIMTPPQAALPADETNRYLAKFKTSVDVRSGQVPGHPR